MPAPSVRQRAAGVLREDRELVALFVPRSPVTWMVAPLVAVVALVVAWVVGVLVLAAAGAVIGSDVLEAVSGWAKGLQAVLYVAVAVVAAVAVRLVVVVSVAVFAARQARAVSSGR